MTNGVHTAVDRDAGDPVPRALHPAGVKPIAISCSSETTPCWLRARRAMARSIALAPLETICPVKRQGPDLPPVSGPLPYPAAVSARRDLRRPRRVRKLDRQRRPREVARAEAGSGVRVVVLAQPLALDGGAHLRREPLRLLVVAEAHEAQPQHPRGVDPRRPAPVAAQQAAGRARLERRLARCDRGRRVLQPEAIGVEQVLLDHPAADLLGQVGERERRERRPRLDRRPLAGGKRLVEEQAAVGVV